MALRAGTRTMGRRLPHARRARGRPRGSRAGPRRVAGRPVPVLGAEEAILQSSTASRPPKRRRATSSTGRPRTAARAPAPRRAAPGRRCASSGPHRRVSAGASPGADQLRDLRGAPPPCPDARGRGDGVPAGPRPGRCSANPEGEPGAAMCSPVLPTPGGTVGQGRRGSERLTVGRAAAMLRS